MKVIAPLGLASLATAAHLSPQQYESGEVHAKSMARKHTERARHRAAGDFDSWKWPSLDNVRSRQGPKNRREYVKCSNGYAVVEQGKPNQTFACKNVRTVHR